MTAANEFIPGGEQAEESSAKEIFGIKLTPQIQAIAIAVVGLGIAGGIGYQFVLPEIQKSGEIKQKISEGKQTTKFEPDILPAAAPAVAGAVDPDILKDTSFGASLAGKLRRKKYKTWS